MIIFALLGKKEKSSNAASATTNGLAPAMILAAALWISGCGTAPYLNSANALQSSTSNQSGTTQPSSGPSLTTPSSSTSPVTSSSGGSSTHVPHTGPLPAFPGAQGGGAASVGGRGGVVMEVTNLDDSGSGSFRACMEGSGLRTCVFRVAGIITLATGIRVVNPYLTVAGQSAPGGGIEVDGHLIQGGDDAIFVMTHDVVIRYLRVRVGNSAMHAPGPLTGVACFYVGNGNVYNVMIDHVSMSWSDNKDITPYNNSGTAGVTRRYTTSWSILSESIEPHSTGFMTGNVNGTADNMTDIDIHHTLFAHINHRNPLLKNKSSRVVNNLIYDWVFYAFEGLGGLQADGIGNIFKPGPSSDTSIHEFELSDNHSGGDTSTGTPTLYLEGNIGPHQSSSTGDQWAMTAEVPSENGSEGASPIHGAWQRSSPLPAPAFPIIADGVNNLETVMLLPPLGGVSGGGVGASQRLDCLGHWANMRDSYDTRIINDYISGGYSNGSIPVSTSSTVYPTIAPGTPCVETAHDGLPDLWKITQGFSASDTAMANTVAPNGYTYLENYLNGTNPN